MSTETQQPDREEQAKREIGHTTFGRGVAPFLATCLLATVFGLPLLHHLFAWRQAAQGESAPGLACYDAFGGVGTEMRQAWGASATTWSGCLGANAAFLRRLNTFGQALDDTFVLAQATRAPVQAALCRAGVGNEKVFLGQDGWLFYEPDLTVVTGPGFLSERQIQTRQRTLTDGRRVQPDPVLAILHLQLQLARRGIRLVVLPAPVKTTVHPEQFVASVDDTQPLQNPAFDRFVAELSQPRLFFEGRFLEWERQARDLADPAWRKAVADLRAGAALLLAEPPLVFDPAPLLVARKQTGGEAQYLKTDTHWTPDAMQAVATELATRLRDAVALPEANRTLLRAATHAVVGKGDIGAMLKLPPGSAHDPAQTVTIRQIGTSLTEGQALWRPDKAAPVLLLGDSFANIYSLEALGWGEAAGLAEQLAFELGLPVDTLIRNDGGSHATRELLAGELRKGRDRLAGKRVVVYEFAARELALGDWSLTDLSLGKASPTRFFVPPPGQVVGVAGTVAAVTPAPRPGSVPYRDHVVAVHLVDLESADPAAQGGEALVFALSMTNNVWCSPARYRLGQNVRLDLRAWPDVADRFGSLNRAEPDDEELVLQDPCWGEEVAE